MSEQIYHDQMIAEKSGASDKPKVNLVPARLPRGGILIGPILLLIIWQIASTSGLLSPKFLAPPLTALTTGVRLTSDGTLGPHFLSSASRAGSGLLIGVTTGLALAFVAGLSRIGDALVDGLVQVKRAIPTLALIPLAILWLGIGDAMKIALIALGCAVPVYINTHAALLSIDARFVELAHSIRLTRLEFIRNIVLPGALPGFFTGLRLSVTACWTALVVLEQINTNSGIGYLMNRARDYGQTDVIVVGLFIYAGLGLSCDAAVRAWERRALSWRKGLGSSF